MRQALLAMFVLSTVSCHAREKATVTDGGERGIASATPSAVLRPAGSTSPTSDGKTCQTDRECPSGLHCLFEASGCQQPGHCKTPDPAPECYVAIAMCSCRERRTFYGPGGCSGAAGEPWEIYACPCSSDTDCRGGQRCVAVSNKPHPPGATKECRDPGK